MIDGFNRWYDALREPWRFLLAMTLAMSGIAALSFGNYPVKFAGAIYLCVLLGIRIRGSFNATT